MTVCNMIDVTHCDKPKRRYPLTEISSVLQSLLSFLIVLIFFLAFS